MFSAEKIITAIIDFMYQQMIEMFSILFVEMNKIGLNLFNQIWIKQVVGLFQNIGWVLFSAGLVIAVFEFAIESQGGRGDLKSVSINVIKGFFAVNLFANMPVLLYSFALEMQSNLSKDMTLTLDLDLKNGAMTSVFTLTNPLFLLLVTILIGYAIVKVMFDSLKRGGIILIQIAVGSLYMLSVVRGFSDGFVSWCKQIIALCLTSFLQSTMLTAGLLIIPDHFMIGLGVMLAAGEIPRIAGHFGLETGTRFNVSSVFYTTQGAMNLVKTIGKLIK
jgi:hypothetical protein